MPYLQEGQTQEILVWLRRIYRAKEKWVKENARAGPNPDERARVHLLRQYEEEADLARQHLPPALRVRVGPDATLDKVGEEIARYSGEAFKGRDDAEHAYWTPEPYIDAATGAADAVRAVSRATADVGLGGTVWLALGALLVLLLIRR